jgi:hypothetical protein
MKRLFTLGLALTLLAAGCEDSSTTTPAPADVATATDTATGTDTSTTGTDATAAGTDAKVTPDVQTEKKCGINDNACLTKCQQTTCKTESAACQADAKCTALNNCLNGCPASNDLPKDVTVVVEPGEATPTTCTEYCFAVGGKDARAKFNGVINCTFGKCVACDPEGPKATYDQCINACGQAKCSEGIDACLETTCGDFLTCANKCEANDQACIQKCGSDTLDAEGQQILQEVGTCIQEAEFECQ